jgi:hypothetical protein
VQLFVFEIKKDPKKIPGAEVRGQGSAGHYWVMQDVIICAKANSQCSEWSEGLHLLHTFPTNMTIPEATGKHHLFKKSTCKLKPLEQSPKDLKDKLDSLRLTVSKVSELSLYTEEAGNWWDQFFVDRVSMTLEQHGIEIAPPDSVLVVRVTSLLWGNTHVQVGAIAIPVVRPVNAVQDTAMGLLTQMVTERVDTVNRSEWGRRRQVGYLTINPGEDPEVVRRVAVAKEKSSRALDVDTFFEDILNNRGPEAQFIAKIQVGIIFHCFQKSTMLNMLESFLKLFECNRWGLGLLLGLPTITTL